MNLKNAVIGIPKYLSYFSFSSLWETYLKNMGFEVQTSMSSNKNILDAGVRETVNDACIPIKIFHGHVVQLKDKVDYLFIPRLAGNNMRYTVCPKFLGLPDMVKMSIPDLPDVLAPRLEMGAFGLKSLRGLLRMGMKLTGERIRPVSALNRARRALRSQIARVQKEGLKAFGYHQAKNTDIRVGLVGYPYVVYDRLANGGILSNLKRLNVAVLTPEMVSDKRMKEQSKEFSENLFWYYSNRSLWSGNYFIKDLNVDGLIHITAFGCGPDAMVSKLLEMKAGEYQVPFMSIIVDEHTGQVGLQTRAEAFVDMLRWDTEGDDVVS